MPRGPVSHAIMQTVTVACLAPQLHHSYQQHARTGRPACAATRRACTWCPQRGSGAAAARSRSSWPGTTGPAASMHAGSMRPRAASLLPAACAPAPLQARLQWCTCCCAVGFGVCGCVRTCWPLQVLVLVLDGGWAAATRAPLLPASHPAPSGRQRGGQPGTFSARTISSSAAVWWCRKSNNPSSCSSARQCVLCAAWQRLAVWPHAAAAAAGSSMCRRDCTR